MRIVHLCRTAPPGSGEMEELVGALAQRQADSGHQVRLITLDRGRGAQASGVEDVSTLALRPVGPRMYPFGRGLAAALGEPDILHIHGIDGLADQALSARSSRTKVGVSTHGGFVGGEERGLLKWMWMRFFTRWSLGRADAIWFTSERDRLRLRPAGLSGDVVRSGVDLGMFRSARAHREPEPGYFVVQAPQDHDSGLDHLFRTLSGLTSRSGTPFTLHIIGKVGSLALQHQLEVLGRTYGLREHLLWNGDPTPNDLVEAYRRCEFAFFPGASDPFGTGLLRAMASGVAPVAQAIPEHTDKMEHGVHGYFIDFRDPDAAFRELMEIRERNRSVLRAAAVDRAEEWSWDAVYTRWEEAYARLLTQG